MHAIEDFRKARDVLQPVLLKTNLVYSEYFSKATDNKIYLKPENMQITGSYKIRGAYYKIATLPREERNKGLITSSAGNHAQGLAYAASLKKVKSTIVMPTTTPLVKVNNTKKHGANVVLSGDIYDDAYQKALELSEQEGYTFVHPFNDLDIATGQGTIAYEILKDLPDTDIILVPIGGGGLAAGVATLVSMLNPHIRVIGVEPKGACSMKTSLGKGEITSIPRVDTIADGVAVRTPGDKVFPYIQKYIDDIITIDDTELIDAFLDMMENHKMIVENAGLLTVAAIKHLNVKNQNIVPILSGGNMDVITMSSLVQHGLINRGRIFTFTVQLPDRPGELVRVANIIAQEKGNIVKLDHNQFVNINRNAAVELQVTLEAFGHEHKDAIIEALFAEGYHPIVCAPTNIYR